ncbi:FTR1 family iron permease [Neobacillus sp. MM2021_6]|uniref:FTR1 family iron permease n=1 Tax=Bacillaceae TaxID=186817 RepID=UPI00140C400E|nr:MULTISPECIES: FTR1 family protein [Bacillaceae]MBO0960662.1 FTR1 family iron permease [Neobacillus sp. MM2021_6]NHC18384.1 FTR1 family iron permease [Bacillus sp. MM2020_4]
MPRLTKICKQILLLTSFLVLFQNIHPAAAAENHDELFVLIGDSLMKAKAGDQTVVAENMKQFADEWLAIKKADSKQAKMVDQQLKEVQRVLGEGNVENEILSKSLSSLSSAVVQYEKEQNPTDKAKGKEQVKQLLPLINNLKASIEKGDTASLKGQYQTLLNEWTASEKIVHDESIAAYGNIEKYTALIRIAITQEPADLEKAKQNAEQLTTEVDNFLAGKTSKQLEGNYSLTNVSNLLTQAEKQISEKDYQGASSQLTELLTIWPMVEGDVSTRDSKLYSDIETKIPTAISILNSEKVNAEKATDIVKELNTRLAPLLSKTNYSLWDAALILLREGLEGLLIIVTLIAFLKKMGQSSQQKWIWAGVIAGLLASAVLAVIINIVFSKIVAASSREYIEGLTGVVAVVMMLTIGAWLHNKSSIGNWNKYINQQMQQAIAKGSLLSFGFISFLSVFREGAETIIFYTGITPYISLAQLTAGILLAIGILAIVGFLIIKYSVKIPIRLFFKVGTLLIYFLAFKILGISIHALQISNVLPTSTVENLPFIDWLGLYPTWETTISQLGLLAVIVFMTYLVKRNSDKPLITTNV